MGNGNIMSYHTHWTFTTDSQGRKITNLVSMLKERLHDQLTHTLSNKYYFKYPAVLAVITMETGKQRVNFLDIERESAISRAWICRIWMSTRGGSAVGSYCCALERTTHY